MYDTRVEQFLARRRKFVVAAKEIAERAAAGDESVDVGELQVLGDVDLELVGDGEKWGECI